MLRSVLLILILGFAVNAFKVLILHPFPSISHQAPVMALTEALVKKGHQLFVVSPNVVPGLAENYTYVDVSFSYKYVSEEKGEETINLQTQITKWGVLKLMESVFTIPGRQFKSSAFLQFYKQVKIEEIKFDVVLVEFLYIPFGCAMSRLLNGNGHTPIISFSSGSADFFTEGHLGSISHHSFIPSFMDPYTDKMNMLEKIDSWFSTFYIQSKIEAAVTEAAENFFREAYGQESVKLVDGCWSNTSLSMVSSNFLYFYPRLLGPNVIELGPMHIKEPAKLPKNIHDWLDGADKGVIYFSLGSNMKSKSLPVAVRENFLKFFRELPAGYRVLWKWELDGTIPGQSDNILAQKWTPQQSVLAHPKVRVFITQGGLQSFQETVHHGVPTVGIPWFGDQELNVAKMVDAGIGSRLRPQELYSFEKVKAAVEAVLYGKSYLKNIKRLSAISREFTSQSLDKAVFWVEHIAKYGDANHLRPSTADATLFEYLCLDIIAVILVSILIVFYLIRNVFSFIVRSISPLSGSKIKKS
uniref:UDP-glucuronosyltransferase n=1 Tax=Trialeurodes vaporariorum TaxID=88556 RepID=A0A873P529_TRIVP|nr:UDP-gluconosyltransferase [Trialeurodes vaporariorum]